MPDAYRLADAFRGPAHAPFDLPAAGGRAGEHAGEQAGEALLVHGFPGTPAETRALGEVLAGLGWRARGLLLPGFGPGLDDLASSGRDAWLGAVRAAWAATPRPRLLVGYSMGAALALAAAADDPPDALVLVAPMTRILAGWPAWAWPVYRRLARHLPLAPFARWDDPGFRAAVADVLAGADVDDPAVRRAVEASRWPTRILADVLALGRAAEGLAPRLACPALVVQGAADALVRPARTRALVAAYGGPVTYVEVPGAVHEAVKPGRPGHEALLAAVAQGLRATIIRS